MIESKLFIDVDNYDWTRLSKVIEKKKLEHTHIPLVVTKELENIIYSMTIFWHILPEEEAASFLLVAMKSKDKLIDKWDKTQGSFKGYFIGAIYKLSQFYVLRQKSQIHKETICYAIKHHTAIDPTHYCIETNKQGEKELIMSTYDSIEENEPLYRSNSYSILEKNLSSQTRILFDAIVDQKHFPLSHKEESLSATERTLHAYLNNPHARKSILLYFLTFPYDNVSIFLTVMALLFSVEVADLQALFLSIRPLISDKICEQNTRRDTTQMHLNSLMNYIQKEKAKSFPTEKVLLQRQAKIKTSEALIKKSCTKNKAIRISQSQLASALHMKRGTIAGNIARAKKILESCL